MKRKVTLHWITMKYAVSRMKMLHIWIHTTKMLPIDFLYKRTAHLTPFSRLWSNWSSQAWYHFEDWDNTSSTNMKKTIWWRLFFWDTEPWRDACYLQMFLDIGNARVLKRPHSTKKWCEKNFASQWLSMISFKFYVQTPFFSTFITLHLGKGHIQTVNRHSGPDGVCYGQLI